MTTTQNSVTSQATFSVKQASAPKSVTGPKRPVQLSLRRHDPIQVRGFGIHLSNCRYIAQHTPEQREF